MQNDELIARLEAATGDEQRELLLDVFEAIHPYPGPDHYLKPDIDWTWDRLRERFVKMLNAEAYESAALTLVPEGWHLAALGFIHPDFRQETELDWRADIFGQVTWAEDDGFPEPQYEAAGGNAPTPALAIVIAALRARNEGEGA